MGTLTINAIGEMAASGLKPGDTHVACLSKHMIAPFRIWLFSSLARQN